MVGKFLFLFAVNNNLLYDIDYCKKQKNYYQIIFIYYLIILLRDILSTANSDIITQSINNSIKYTEIASNYSLKEISVIYSSKKI